MLDDCPLVSLDKSLRRSIDLKYPCTSCDPNQQSIVQGKRSLTSTVNKCHPTAIERALSLDTLDGNSAESGCSFPFAH